MSKICHLSICQMSIRGILALKSLYNKKIYLYIFFIIGKICAPLKKIPPTFFLDRLTDDRLISLSCYGADVMLMLIQS